MRDELRNVAEDPGSNEADDHRPRVSVSERGDDVDLMSVVANEYGLTSRNPIDINGTAISGLPHPT